MPVPAVHPQTRAEQIRTIKNHGMAQFHWVIAVATQARDFNMETPTQSKIWVPAQAPAPYVPYIKVTHPDPQRNTNLCLLLGLMTKEFPDGEFYPLLLPEYWIEQIKGEKPMYEWPHLPADDLVCLQCGAITRHEFDTLLPVRCDVCDAVAPFRIDMPSVF
jgi:hypothetical protein